MHIITLATVIRSKKREEMSRGQVEGTEVTFRDAKTRLKDQIYYHTYSRQCQCNNHCSQFVLKTQIFGTCTAWNTAQIYTYQHQISNPH